VTRQVDETYVCICGKWHYLYRAVDEQAMTVDFLLRLDRGVATAQAFFRKALATNPTRWPRKVTLDGHLPTHCTVRLLRRKSPKWKYVEMRCSKHLNSIIGQDHIAIKRRRASITISGIELAHRIHKRQFSLGPGRRPRRWSLKRHWERALA
jgi:putative transposase